MKDPIWEGVYANFAEVPLVGPGLGGVTWVESCLKKAVTLRDMHEDSSQILPREGLLSLVVGMALSQQESLRVLDFGGGLGFALHGLRRCLPPKKRLHLDVVEGSAICGAGRKFYAEEPDICFHESLATIVEGPDIIHVGSTLQYIEEWKDLLGQLASLKPRWLLLSDLPAGSFTTYATAQNYYGSKIPCWFFNKTEVMRAIEHLGFGLCYQAPCLSMILGKTDNLPQDNFDEHLRVGRSINILYTGGTST